MKLQICYILLALFLCAGVSYSASVIGTRRLHSLKDQAYRAHQERVEKAWTQCSVNPQSPPHKTVLNSVPQGETACRFRRAVAPSIREHVRATSVRGLQLFGQVIGTLVSDSKAIVPTENFTLEVWVKTEGGQNNPTVLLAAEDLCSSFVGKGWELGLQSKEGAGDRTGHLYFRLQTVQDSKDSVVHSAVPHNPTVWSHVAATYDGENTILYVDGTQVSIGHNSKGPIFRKHTSFSCTALLLGGSEEKTTFRGVISQIRIWDRPMIPSDLKRLMHSQHKQEGQPGLVFEETFETLDTWEWPTSTATHMVPRIVAISLPSKKYDLMPRSPPCGFTVCDDPEIVSSYVENNSMRSLKNIRYQVVNVRNSDGSNPTVSAFQIALQHQALIDAFAPYNITFELSQVDVSNTSLRRRTVTFGCSTWDVGNGVCNPECQFNITSFDGGDCRDADKGPICNDHRLIGNGECNSECNVVMHDWDGGDCCNTSISDTAVTCADPDSIFRAYMDVSEYKRILKVKSDRQLSVFFARWTNKEILGVATFPWEKDAFTELGGIILRPSDFGIEGHLDTLVHEVGHALGLWHVHRGVSEVDCGDPCFEGEPSMLLGDLCQDTRPTTANPSCQDPPPETARCGLARFKDTPFRNYMSYADDSCTSSFSSQQAARMHCYIDLRYPSWLENSRSSPSAPPTPPLPPQVVESKRSHIQVAWIPPLNDALYLDSFSCDLCTHERALVQYAHAAVSSVQSLAYADAWQPHQATGPSDAEVCTPSVKAWMPDAKLCEGRECSLTLEYLLPVHASSLAIWISWNAHMGLADVELLFQDGSSHALGPFTSSCDAPLTIPLNLLQDKVLNKVRLTTNGSFVSVDAVQLISMPSHPVCSPCKPLRYKVHRKPSFSFGPSVDVEETEFTDREVQPGVTYSYSVQAWFGSLQSSLSLPLLYKHFGPICGDGKVNSFEECDDGNLISGDGCSRKCQIEKFFYCKGEPSSCYWHLGDGVCESFEESSVVEDCGYFTPAGFSDQWASSVSVHSRLQSPLCPPQVMLGPPVQKPLSCGLGLNASRAWYPCEMFTPSSFWLKLYFPQPVVATAVLIHLASDGLVPTLEVENSMSVELISIRDTQHFVSQVHLSCSHNPLLVPVSQDLSQPFFLTKGVKLTYSVPEVSIAAVQLRSYQYLNPVAIESCSLNDLYSVSLGKCVKYQCDKPKCSEPFYKNAVWECNGRDESSLCNVTCQDGFLSAGDAGISRTSVVCLDGHWDGTELACKPIDCGLPSIAHADSVCQDGTTYGKICNFKCRPPARLRGPGQNGNGHYGSNGNGGSSSLPSVVCLKSGSWSVPESHCLVSCPPPSAPDHSVLSSTGQACSHLKESFHYGHRCRFRCKIGYHVFGNSPRSRSFQLTCDATGSWSGGSCTPVICPAPETFVGGSHNCTDAFFAGSVCQFHCSGRKDIWATSRCEADGVWNSTFQDCPGSSPQTSCPPPQQPLDSTIRITCNPKHAGTRCQVSCIQHDHEPLVKNSSDEQETGLGNKPRLLCSSQGQWIPNPQALVCREKCNLPYIGDGYCDASNNQKRCDWDGGDCCASKVKGHVVKPFPSHCTSQCRCLDPSAKENQARP